MWSISPSGNQRTQPNRISNSTSDPVVSPVSTQDLADYLGVSPADPLLAGLLLEATDAIQRFANVELCERAWTWRADRYPERQEAFLGLGAMPALAAWWIDLPAWPLVSVDSVTARDYDVDLAGGRVFVRGPDAPLVIEYTAGYQDGTVPPIFLGAIKQLAAYAYEHRGECDADDSGRRSGAFAKVAGAKRYAGGL